MIARLKSTAKQVSLWILGTRFARPALRWLAGRKLARFPQPYKLHLGCGSVRMDGWLNVDLDGRNPAVDLTWDLANGLLFTDDSCQLIYCEHVLEHFPVEQGVNLLRECRRVLTSGGILRIAMPSLDAILEKAMRPDWRQQAWLTWPEYQSIQTRAEMLNVCFYWWGHRWLYDREELHRRLGEAGFASVQDLSWGVSEVPKLQNRETRKDSLLICEARK